MLIAAIILALLGFVFLVLAVQLTADIWTYLSLLSTVTGLVLWGIDYIKKQRNR